VAPWAALVPLVLLLRARRPFVHGLLYGITYWLVSIPWIVGTLETFGGLGRPVAIGSLVLLSVYLGSYYAVFAAVGAFLWRRSARWILWSLPALWVALEVIRAWMISGFPWNLAAYAWTDVPGALELSAWIGAYGISFLVVAANVAAALLVTRSEVKRSAGVIAGVVALLALGLVATPDGPTAETGKSVRILQPNTPILQEWDSEAVMRGYQRLLKLSAEACEQDALVVWPESAAWPFLIERDRQLRADVERLNEGGCWLILNSISRQGDKQFNSAFLFDPQSASQRYDKAHLVPFGEYVPFARVLPFVRRIARAAGDFSPGVGGQQLSWGEESLGLAICFEIVFAGEVAARVRHGATVLVTITNDGWYGDTAAPWQHFRAARFRAAENRRPLIRAALTGVSAFISPRGKVEQILGVGEEGILEASLAGRQELTFYSRFSWLVPLACWLLLAFAILRPAFGAGDEARDRVRGRES
jgi:apolipoprotein N-acyltransferase